MDSIKTWHSIQRPNPQRVHYIRASINKRQLFEKKALVEVFILKLVKTQKPFETTIKNLIFTDGKLVKDSADGRDLDIVFPYHFSKLADIRRGLTTGHNKMYVNPTLNDDNYEQYIIPIVSSPKAVKGYSTRSAFLDKILILDKSNHSDMPQNLRSYLNAQKQQILADKKPKTLFEKIKSNENNWFEIKNFFDGRGERTRTSDLTVPNRAR